MPDTPKPERPGPRLVWLQPGAKVWYAPNDAVLWAAVVDSEPRPCGASWVVRLRDLSCEYKDGQECVGAASVYSVFPRNGSARTEIIDHLVERDRLQRYEDAWGILGEVAHHIQQAESDLGRSLERNAELRGRIADELNRGLETGEAVDA